MMKRIYILTCVWRRFDLNDIFYRYVEWIIKRNANSAHISVVVVGSEGSTSERHAHSYGFTYIEAANSPLSAKWQCGLDFLKGQLFDAVLILGSDDFISPGLIEHYLALLDRQDVLAVGVLDAYFLDIEGKRWIYWPGYGRSSVDTQPQRSGEPIGAGRLLTFEILKRVNFEVWSHVQLNKGLDRACFLRLSTSLDIVPYSKIDLHADGSMKRDKWVVIDAASIDEAILDVKTDVFVTDFGNYKSDVKEKVFEFEVYNMTKRRFSRRLCIDLLKLRLVSEKG